MSPTLNPQILGQAENAHRALLDRALSGTDLTYQEWVALKVAFLNQPAPIPKISGSLKITPSRTDELIDSLVHRGLLDRTPASITLTETSSPLVADISAEITTTITRIYAVSTPEDLATAARVLSAITTRANEELTPTTSETGT